MQLRALAAIAGMAISGIVTSGAFAPARAVSLLTSDVGYTGPGLDLSAYANGSYNFTAGPKSIPGGITFTSTNSNSVLGQGYYGIVGFDGYPGNSYLDVPSVYAGLNSGNGYMTFSFATPVREFGAFVNYAPKGGVPGVPSELWDNPTISAYDSANKLLGSFNLSVLAPISTPGNPPGGGDPDPNNVVFNPNQFRFRGIRIDDLNIPDSGTIASFRMGGSRIVATGNATGTYPTAVPEPLTVIGTIVGATAAFRLRKKLTASKN